MKKFFKATLFLYLVNSFSGSDIIGQVQREGLISNITNYPIAISPIQEYPLEKKENKIWFLDSCIIWEYRVNYVSEEPAGDSGRIEKKSYPVGWYTYFDLRTKYCQDYLSFKDTATPFCNYYLTDEDTSPFYGFFFPKIYPYPLDSFDVIITVADTTINNVVLKRVSRLRKTYTQGYVRGTFYFNCNMPKTIFKFGFLEKNKEIIYPDCQIVKNEVIFDSSGINVGGAEKQIIRYKLTQEEKNIFKCWQQNSKKTVLPLLTYNDVMKLIHPSPEHENPVITIIPREQ
jgi:hypothetical protein